MITRLPIPIFKDDSTYKEIEFKKPTPGVLADTQKVAQSGDSFSAIIKFLQGCIVRIDDISDRVSISSLVRNIPYKTSEYCNIKIMTSLDEDDGIEGIYGCPRCKHSTIAEKKSDIQTGELIFDNRDHISDLVVTYYEGDENKIYHEFKEPFEIKNASNGEVIQEIYNISMRFPTMDDCIKASQKQGKNDDMRFQFAVYLEALTHVNEQSVDSRFKNMFGMKLFEIIPDVKNDLWGIKEKVDKYGISRRIKKVCPSCGKEWMALVNTSGFFEYDLHSI